MKSLEELKSIRERMHEELKIRYESEEYYQAGRAQGLENGSQYRKHVLVCDCRRTSGKRKCGPASFV